MGITNPRLTTAKRAIAVEVATELAATTDTPVCLVGADPTDRGVDRLLSQLARAWGTPSRIQVPRGPRHVEVATFSRSRICVVSASDREHIELVFPTLQERFRFMIVDASSHAGMGVGIAGVLLDWLDALFVATALEAGELAETRRFVEHLDARPRNMSTCESSRSESLPDVGSRAASSTHAWQPCPPSASSEARGWRCQSGQDRRSRTRRHVPAHRSLDPRPPSPTGSRTGTSPRCGTRRTRRTRRESALPRNLRAIAHFAARKHRRPPPR